MDSEVPGSWTDEKHVDFLNKIEASFVRSLAGKINARRRRTCVPRLDRHCPDAFDSTQHLRSQPKSNKPLAATGVVGSNIHRRRRRFSPQPHDSSIDQVVPQMESSIRDDKDDDKDYPNGAVSSSDHREYT